MRNYPTETPIDMRLVKLFFAALFALTFVFGSLTSAEDVKSGVRGAVKLAKGPIMGINLAGVCDWNTELPFVDVFLETRQWISQRKGESWGGTCA